MHVHMHVCGVRAYVGQSGRSLGVQVKEYQHVVCSGDVSTSALVEHGSQATRLTGKECRF